MNDCKEESMFTPVQGNKCQSDCGYLYTISGTKKCSTDSKGLFISKDSKYCIESCKNNDSVEPLIGNKC